MTRGIPNESRTSNTGSNELPKDTKIGESKQDVRSKEDSYITRDGDAHNKDIAIGELGQSVMLQNDSQVGGDREDAAVPIDLTSVLSSPSSELSEEEEEAPKRKPFLGFKTMADRKALQTRRERLKIALNKVNLAYNNEIVQSLLGEQTYKELRRLFEAATKEYNEAMMPIAEEVWEEQEANKTVEFLSGETA
ncbi:hypothetical protein LTR74_018416 [Friedmanniomyces endolithicus]|nr:hypothetical protein LTR74_018416 [Friedmanniomyces endolithicus]